MDISELIKFIVTCMSALVPREQAFIIVPICIVLVVAYLVYWCFCSHADEVQEDSGKQTRQNKHCYNLLMIAIPLGIALMSWAYHYYNIAVPSELTETIKSTTQDQSGLTSLKPTPIKSITLDQSNIACPTPTPSSMANLESCTDKNMELKDFVLIRHGKSELRLVSLLSKDWKTFWLKVGFSLPKLDAKNKYDVTSEGGKQSKLYEIIGKWMNGAYNKRGCRPIYGVLWRLLQDLELNDLANDVSEAFKDSSKVELPKLLYFKPKDEEIKIIEALAPYWIEFGILLGYPVHIETPVNNRESFLHFCIEWLNQSIPEDERKKYPRTYEGFRQILISYNEFIEDFTTAVEEAGICSFS